MTWQVYSNDQQSILARFDTRKQSLVYVARLKRKNPALDLTVLGRQRWKLHLVEDAALSTYKGLSITTLEAAGLGGIFPSRNAALAWLKRHQPELAGKRVVIYQWF